jgi:hypothetical protein
MGESHALFCVEILSDNHNRSNFSCGIESLDRYLKLQAGQDRKRKLAATFVIVVEDEPDLIAGYYTLSSTAIDPGDLPLQLRERLPQYPLIPATLIGRLARDLRYKGHSVGEYLLADALRRSWQHSKEIASYAVVVDALNEKAYAWYLEQWKFIPLVLNPNKLFLPMKTVEEMFK